MAEKYLSIAGETVTEKVIEKSRFITVSRHVDGEDDAKAFIAEISKKHADATHNCYAYVCDKLGNNLRFSDDGEPQGTAGMPMLEVLRANGLCETAVVVTRYFGGIKLGAGGLVRAYSGCVAENIAAAQKVLYENCAESVYAVDYPEVDAAMRFFNANDCNLLNTAYEDKVAFTVAVKAAEVQAFDSALVNHLNGRVTITRQREYFFPFKI
ncbi:MAG: YigZ family protein [Clostridia bacterium]|nr:YigZ family protein [Clostridia bacterium]